nr:hypothetical protein Iba_chr12bCG21650 [Ipomoea batatas]
MAMISLYPRILKSSPAIGFASVEGNVSFIHLFSLLCIEHFGFSFILNVRLKLLFYNSSVLSFFAVRSAVFELVCILCHRTGTDSKFSSAVLQVSFVFVLMLHRAPAQLYTLYDSRNYCEWAEIFAWRSDLVHLIGSIVGKMLQIRADGNRPNKVMSGWSDGPKRQ